MKRCTSCNEMKSRDAYHAKSAAADGLQSRCKVCVRAAHRVYNQTHREELNRYARERRRANPLARAAVRKRYVANHREEIKQRQRQQYEKHREARKAYSRRYHAQHRAARLAWRHQYCEQYPERLLAVNRRRRARKRGVEERFTPRMVSFTYGFWDHACALCGETANLCVDHWQPLSKGHPLTLANAVVLCQACNSSKGARQPQAIFDSETISRVEAKLLQQCLAYDWPDVGGDLLEPAVA